MSTFNENDPSYLQAKKRVQAIKGFYIHALVYVLVNAFIIYSNAVGDHQGFQTMNNYWTAIFWGIGLTAHGLTVFAPNFFLGKDWEQRKIKELMDKDKNRF